MREFVELATALQVGVRRLPPSRPALLRVAPTDSPERDCLQDLGALDLVQRAGRMPRQGVAPVGGPDEEQKPYALRAVAPLREVLESRNTPLLLEWAQEAERRGYLAPPAVLTDLLLLPRQTLRRLLPVLGSRARWLAHWMDVELPGEEPDRSPEPPELGASWDPAALEAWLEQLNPGPADEERLKVALADRKSKIRELAALALARLPSSGFASALRDLARASVAVEGGSFRVDPPEPKDLPKGCPLISAAELGPRAQALASLVRLIPPDWWERETLKGPAELIKLAGATEYAQALLQGWQAAAAEVFASSEWCGALLTALGHQYTLVWSKLAQLAPEGIYESLLLDQDLDPARMVSLATVRGGVRSPEFSAVIVEKCRKLPFPPPGNIVLHLDLSVRPLLEEPWSEASESVRISSIAVLDLRIRLHRSLTPH